MATMTFYIGTNLYITTMEGDQAFPVWLVGLIL